MSDFEAATLISCIPRSNLKRLLIAFIWISGESTDQSSQALKTLISEAPKLRFLDLILEHALSNPLLAGLSLSHLTSLKLTSVFDYPMMVLISDALKHECKLQELSLSCVSSEDDGQIISGFSLLISTVASTIRSLTIGTFPGMIVEEDEFKKLMDSLFSVECLEVLNFFGRFVFPSFSQMFSNVLQRHGATLKECVLCVKAPVLDLLSPVKFAKLEKFAICANKRMTAIEVDSIVRSVASSAQSLKTLVATAFRFDADDVDAQLVSEASIKLLSTFSKLEHLAIYTLEGGKARSLMDKMSKMPSIRHLGINIPSKGDLILPPNCTSLEFVCAGGDDDEFDWNQVLKLPGHQLQKIVFLSQSMRGDLRLGEDVVSIFENVTHVMLSSDGNVAEDLFDPRFFHQLRQIDVMEITNSNTVWLELLSWQCKVTLQTQMLAQLLGVVLCDGLSEGLLPLLSSFVLSRKRSNQHDHSSTWIEALSSTMEKLKSKKLQAAMRIHRLKRELKLHEMRACVFELGKFMLRFGVPKDLRRMISKLSFQVLIQ